MDTTFNEDIFVIPFNEITQAKYGGSNVLLLTLAAQGKNYSPEHGWATFLQWKQAGRSVMKGQHGTRIAKWLKIEETDVSKERLIPRAYTVFHFDQTQAIETAEVE